MSLPRAALLDTSVLLRLFHDHRDAEQAGAAAVAQAWIEGLVSVFLLDLSIYECVNVAVRKLGFNASRAAAMVGHLYDLDAPIVAVDRALAVEAARTAAETGLSGYDAAFVAAAVQLDMPLITADRRISAVTPSRHVLLLAEVG